MGERTKEQLLDELIEVQKMLEEKTESQGQMIKKLQMLIAKEGLFSQIVDFFPYPLAIFTPRHTLIMTNKAFTAEFQKRFMGLEKEPMQIFQYKIVDMQLATAVTGVFAGDTFFLDNLTKPFSMFSGITQLSALQPDCFRRAVVFPILSDDGRVTHGVIVFMP